ncbi:MAG: hypothetical protein AAF502_06970 [Bacteroidota bacterium]
MLNRMSFLLFPLLWFVSCNTNNQQKVGETKEASGVEHIPFTLTEHNNLVIEGIVNNTDTLKLMLHTAANSVSVTEEAVEKITSMEFEASGTANSWGGSSETRSSPNNSLSVANFEWDSLRIWENKHSGHGTDGKIGPDLFEGKIFEINFDESLINLYNQLPGNLEAFDKLTIEHKGGFIFLTGNSMLPDSTMGNEFLMHSGYSGSILFDDEFVNANKLGKILTTISESELSDAYGNKLKTKKAILPGFTLGSTTFNEIPIGFFEGAIGRQQMSVMGGEIIKRFNWIMDLESGHIYIKQNSLHNLPFPTEQ